MLKISISPFLYPLLYKTPVKNTLDFQYSVAVSFQITFFSIFSNLGAFFLNIFILRLEERQTRATSLIINSNGFRLFCNGRMKILKKKIKHFSLSKKIFSSYFDFHFFISLQNKHIIHRSF